MNISLRRFRAWLQQRLWSLADMVIKQDSPSSHSNVQPPPYTPDTFGLDLTLYYNLLPDSELPAVIRAITIAVCTATVSGRWISSVPVVTKGVAEAIAAVAHAVVAVPADASQVTATAIATAVTNYAAVLAVMPFTPEQVAMGPIQSDIAASICRIVFGQAYTAVPAASQPALMKYLPAALGHSGWVVVSAPTSAAPDVAFAIGAAVAKVANAIATTPAESRQIVATAYASYASHIAADLANGMTGIAAAAPTQTP